MKPAPNPMDLVKQASDMDSFDAGYFLGCKLTIWTPGVAFQPKAWWKSHRKAFLAWKKLTTQPVEEARFQEGFRGI